MKSVGDEVETFRWGTKGAKEIVNDNTKCQQSERGTFLVVSFFTSNISAWEGTWFYKIYWKTETTTCGREDKERRAWLNGRCGGGETIVIGMDLTFTLLLRLKNRPRPRGLCVHVYLGVFGCPSQPEHVRTLGEGWCWAHNSHSGWFMCNFCLLMQEKIGWDHKTGINLIISDVLGMRIDLQGFF